MIRRTVTIALATLIAISAGAAQKKQSILSLKESITDKDIVYPESFETNTTELMQNWYLQNYTVLDADVEKRDAVVASDAEYVKRLSAMPTVIEMPYNQVVRSYIDRYVTRNRTLVEEMLGMSLYYMPIFEQALEQEGLPLELKYLPVIESALNPNAVSHAGAAGLWQFMVSTGKGMGLEVNSLVDERRDPYRSSEAAAKYLKSLFNIYNDWSLALAAYNCGPGNVNKALARAGNSEKKLDFWDIYYYLPRETRGYVPAFIAANYVMTYFKRHNISASLAKKPLITDTVSVNRYVNFNQISGVLNIPIEEIRVLNPQFRRDVIPGNNHAYTLTLPSQQIYSYIMSEDSIANYRSELYAQREIVEPVSETSVQGDGGSYTWETKQVTQYHKVRRGEKLGGIAKRYGMSVATLKSMNRIKGNSVHRGQTLRVVTTKRVKVYKQQPQEDMTPNEEPRPDDGSDLNEPIVAENNVNSSEESEEDTQDYSQAAAQNAQRASRQSASAYTPYKGSYSVNSDPAPEPEVKSQASQAHEINNYYKSQTGKRQGKDKNYRNSRSSRSVVAQPTKHTVKEGENLTKIAKRNGVTVEELKKANNIKGDQINTGSTIVIPQKQTATSHKKTGRRHRRHR